MSKVVPCPRCGQPSIFAPSNRWRPFCSERCSCIDLGAWSSEAYRVEARPPVEDDHDEPDLKVPDRPL
jgi:endogenous inhibitor of DNA gyrase (YacG/DUF329 family)